MGKKSRSDHHHASFKGKRPANKAKNTTTKSRAMIKNPGRIKNKMKRSEMYGKYLQQKREAKIAAREEREREREEARPQECLGEDVIKAIPVPKTLDNTRVRDVTMVQDDDDDEIAAEQGDDEFAPYFRNVNVRPKVLITTRPKPSSQVFYFIADLQRVIPSLHYYPRRVYTIKEICHFASNRNFTHVMVLSEKHKRVNGLTISHLRPPPPSPSPPQAPTSSRGSNSAGDEDVDDDVEEDNASTTRTREEEEEEEEYSGGTSAGGCGPTAFLKLSNVVTSKNIPNHGVACSSFLPELNLTGFGTRLGQRVGRLLGSLFPAAAAQLEGRQVVTFHNQRDYIFVRQHRYVFEEKNKKNVDTNDKKKNGGGKQHNASQQPQPFPVKARLQELGPRFTLKLRWLQEGTFDTKFGEYEWIHKRKEMDTTRRTFHL